MRLRDEQRLVLLYFMTDVLLYWISLTAVTFLRFETLYQVNMVLVQRDRLLCTLVFAAAAVVAGCYAPARLTDRFDSVYYGLLAVAAAACTKLVFVAIVPVELRAISRRELVLGDITFAVLLSLWHCFAAGLLARFAAFHQVFCVVGAEGEGNRIVREVNRGNARLAEAHYIDFEQLVTEADGKNDESDLAPACRKDVILVPAEWGQERFYEALAFCESRFRRTYLYPSLNDTLLFQHSRLLHIGGVPLIEVGAVRPSTAYPPLKRLLDILCAGLGLLLSAPICFVTAISIKVTSPGPVLYCQERLGRYGRPFRMYKFRSMRSGIELRNESGHVLVQTDDPRLTRVGRFIRKHRIDEIPQLFNILKGDMSLIGPRPVWREFYEEQRETLPLFERRLAVRPGLTSLSHVMGSYDSDPKDRLRYDLVYIHNLSFLIDLRILLGTVRIVLSGKGAR